MIYIDIFGPSRTTSFGSNYYALVIVDDFSRFTWKLFLVRKHDTFNTFKTYVKLVKNEKSINIVSIRSDRSEEFQNSSFEIFCDENGISHNFFVLRTPSKMELLK